MRGRPKGSKNKPKVAPAADTAAAVATPPKPAVSTDKDFDQLQTVPPKRSRYSSMEEIQNLCGIDERQQTVLNRNRFSNPCCSFFRYRYGF